MKWRCNNLVLLTKYSWYNMVGTISYCKFCFWKERDILSFELFISVRRMIGLYVNSLWKKICGESKISIVHVFVSWKITSVSQPSYLLCNHVTLNPVYRKMIGWKYLDGIVLSSWWYVRFHVCTVAVCYYGN